MKPTTIKLIQAGLVAIPFLAFVIIPAGFWIGGFDFVRGEAMGFCYVVSWIAFVILAAFSGSAFVNMREKP